MKFKWVVIALCGTLLWGLQSCGEVGEPEADIRACLVNPYIFPNDPAANDSLNLALINGVQFVLTPGSEYTFEIEGAGFKDAKLYLERVLPLQTLSFPNPVKGKLVDGRVHFTFTSVADTVEQVWGVLRSSQEGALFKAPTDVYLTAEGFYSTGSLAVNYHFLGALDSLPTDSLKSLFRDSVHTGLKAYLQESLEVDLVGSDALVASMTPSVSVSINLGFQLRDSLRVGENSGINIVFVNSITPHEDRFLAFAPVFGFSFEKKPVLVVGLNNPVTGPQTISKWVQVIAHELGHFFGLRHNMPSARDLALGRDLSNLDDGLAGTTNCSELRKTNSDLKVPKIDTLVNWRCAYRISEIEEPPNDCEGNLMYYSSKSDNLTDDQKALIKTNLAVFPH